MMLSTSAAHGRWTACFALAVFQTIVGVAVGTLAVVHMVLASLVQGGPTPHVDACHDSTIAAVLQGITLVVSGSLGVWAYAPFLAPTAPMQSASGAVSVHRQPRLVLVAIHVLFSAVVAFVGYNAAASHGCFALGKGGEKAIFGIVVARVVLSYLCHIVGGLCVGLAMPDLCQAVLKSRHHHNAARASPDPEDGSGANQSENVQRVVRRMNSQTTFVTTENPGEDKKQMLTVITLPDMRDGSTIYAVPKDQFVVQKQDGSVCIPGAGTLQPPASSLDIRLSDIQEETRMDLNSGISDEVVKLVS